MNKNAFKGGPSRRSLGTTALTYQRRHLQPVLWGLASPDKITCSLLFFSNLKQNKTKQKQQAHECMFKDEILTAFSWFVSGS